MAYKSIKYGILTYFGFSLLAPIASANTYVAPHDNSVWSTNITKLSCTLSHEIPGYGTAVFAQESGHRQTFALKSSFGRLVEGKIIISQSPPTWARQQGKSQLAEVSTKLGLVPLQLKKMTVYQLLDGLNRGYQANFEFRPGNTSTKDRARRADIVVLSPTGFQNAYQAYTECVDKLVPYTYDELKESIITFRSASKALSNEDYARLDNIAEMVVADDAIYKVYLEGHSDSVGSFTSNRRLSYERAWIIKDYLVDQGVHPSLIEVKGYGDRKPIAKNNTKAGREKNRRVEVKLYR